MIFRTVDWKLCVINKCDFANDHLYYKKIYDNMLKITKRDELKKENNLLLKKTFHHKNKKQTDKTSKNITTHDIHV